MNKNQKIQAVSELKEKLEKTKSLVLTDYRGLTHQQLEEMKRAMRESGAEFLVTKNRLLKLAIKKELGEKLESSSFEGPTASLFSYEDEIAPFSVLAKFIKNFGLPQIKIGILGEKILKSDEVLKIAALPSREILRATLVARLKSPLYGLHYALHWNLRKLTLVLKAASTSVAAGKGGENHG